MILAHVWARRGASVSWDRELHISKAKIPDFERYEKNVIMGPFLVDFTTF